MVIKMKYDLTVREVRESDAVLLRELAKKCPPLDLHTPYTYWVVAEYFGKCSFIVEKDGTPIGYIMCVLNRETLLIWQIGIREEYRKQGISAVLIDRVFQWYEANRNGRFDITVSISNENQDSFSAFSNYCARRGYEMKPDSEIVLTDPDDPDFHEREILYRITK